MSKSVSFYKKIIVRTFILLFVLMFFSNTLLIYNLNMKSDALKKISSDNYYRINQPGLSNIPAYRLYSVREIERLDNLLFGSVRKLYNHNLLQTDRHIYAERLIFMESPGSILEKQEQDNTEELSLEYQALYPELYSKLPDAFDEKVEEKIVYLTFDDGPSLQTPKILDILDEKEIKATFFVVANETEFGKDMYKRILQEGHELQLHSYSHNYDCIYEDVASFLHDFNKIYTLIYETTGHKASIFRFPGGSINSYNLFSYKAIISEMLRRGFVYYDWNVDSGDADTSVHYTPGNIYNRVVSRVLRNNKSIVLLHDSKNKAVTVEALPDIIDDLLAEGYTFDVLTNQVKPFIFAYGD